MSENIYTGSSSGTYISDFVFAGLDGTVTTFAVVSGVEGASLSASIVLILGFANLLADGFSMAVGNYMSLKSTHEYVQKAKRIEESHIDKEPEIEKHEIREIFKEKGFKGKQLDEAVDIITSDRRIWIDTMMKDELGIIEEQKLPLKGAVVTFFAFNMIGIIPLLAYLFSHFFGSINSQTFPISIVLTSCALFIVGSIKGKILETNWIISGVGTLFMGGAAAAIAYLVGHLLKGLAT
jgi:vacuolar iron transporter family protein